MTSIHQLNARLIITRRANAWDHVLGDYLGDLPHSDCGPCVLCEFTMRKTAEYEARVNGPALGHAV